MNEQRSVLPSRSFISTRPTSTQLQGQRLVEFSLTAIFQPNGKVKNRDLQLEWSEPQKLPQSSPINFLPQKHWPTGFRQVRGHSKAVLPPPSSGTYDDLVITNNDCSTTASSESNIFSRSCCMSRELDCFASSYGASVFSQHSYDDDSTTSYVDSQMVRLVYVSLNLTFFRDPGLFVREKVNKELRNDLTVLEVLQILIQCSGVKLDSELNGDSARLFQLQTLPSGQARYDEIDYLQWRCALLADMTYADSITFMLDFTDSEEDGSAIPPSSGASLRSTKSYDYDDIL